MSPLNLYFLKNIKEVQILTGQCLDVLTLSEVKFLVLLCLEHPPNHCTHTHTHTHTQFYCYLFYSDVFIVTYKIHNLC